MKIQYLIVAVLFTVVNLQSQNDLPRIQVKGNKFVNDNGAIITFQGLNVADPDKLDKEGKWNEMLFKELKSWGANVVRFPVHPKAWRERGAEEYYKLLDKGIELATQQGIYVIIDWHSIGNLRSEVFFLHMYDTSKKETFDFWRKMAERYGNNSTVAFFELFNEPTTYNEKLGTCTWAQWKELMEEIIIIIRANGGKNIPLVAGFNWGYDLTPVRNNPINAEGVAYVSHPYPQKRNQPWEPAWEQDFGYVADKYPVILTEIGFCWPEDKGAHIPVMSDEKYVEHITEYCKEKGMSYTVWVFDPSWSPMMIEDWTFKPTRAGQVWKNAMTKK